MEIHKEQWQENYWVNPKTEKATGVSIIFSTKKDRDFFQKNCNVYFQFENPN